MGGKLPNTSCLLSKGLVMMVLVVWFVIWGICPWNTTSAAAQPYYTAHATHGHASGHAVSDTHHASKGGEHSCRGSASVNQSDLHWKIPTFYHIGTVDLTVTTDLMGSLHRGIASSLPLARTGALPKLLKDFYQLYSVYRL